MIKLYSDSKLVSAVEMDYSVFKIEKQPNFKSLGRDKLGDDRCLDDLLSLIIRLHHKIEVRHKIRNRYLSNSDYICDVLCIPIVNAERHGNKYDPEKVTILRYNLDDKKKLFTVEVEDQGEGFDYRHLIEMEKKAKGTKSYNDFRETTNPYSIGYGLFELIRNTHSVKWNESGNKIRVKLKLMK